MQETVFIEELMNDPHPWFGWWVEGETFLSSGYAFFKEENNKAAAKEAYNLWRDTGFSYKPLDNAK